MSTLLQIPPTHTTVPPPCHFQVGAGWCGFFLMLFIYSKFFELLDTVFLVLRKVFLTYKPSHIHLGGF